MKLAPEQTPKETTLWYCGDNRANKSNHSDKVYIVKLLPAPNPNLDDNLKNRWIVTCLWGKRGKTLQSQVKTEYPHQYWSAESIYTKCVYAKVDKGYVVHQFVTEVEEMADIYEYDS